MPNGDYIASHDIFGDGLVLQNTSKVFRSTNQGVTWTEQATITDAFASTIFYHDGALYLWGYRNYSSHGNADVLIRKSVDNGVTWTTPTDANSGFLLDTNLYGQSNTPAVYNGRIWIALAGKSVMSAPVNSNLLLASSWTASDAANTTNTPWGGNLSITEAQVAASPTGVVVMPKVDGLPNSIVIRVVSPTTVVNFAAPQDYIDLPGGEKKFALQYDAVSQKYFILSNPILPIHAADPTINSHPELIRNTAALLSSKDLRHWDVEKIFLYSPNFDQDLPPSAGDGHFGEAFQYMNFAIEGNDLLVVSRTAFDTDGDKNNNLGERLPPKGHDSNLITFHRIDDFRTAAPTQELALATGNRVVRRELTQYMAAPLGNFHLGTTFAGAALSQPNGMAQDTNGDVYIREQGGRILRFDALGNFYNTVAGLPDGLSFTSGPLAISPPAYGERAWVAGGPATWDELTNWHYWGRPDTNYEVATLGSAIASNTTITMNGSYTMKGLRFRSSNSYLIDGPGEIILSADAGHAIVDVQQGNHRIINPVTLYSDTDWTVAAGARLFFQDALILNGQALIVTGPGQRNIDGTFFMLGGKLVTDGRNQISFTATTQATLNGTLEFVPYAGAPLGLGATHSLFNGMSNINSTFANVNLPILPSTLGWSTANLYTNGSVTVVDVANPEWTKNANGNWEDSGNWLDHGVPNSNQEIALLGTAITSNKTLTMNGAYTLKGLRFNNPANNVYFVDGSGSITIEADTGHGVLDVQAGTHEIRNPVTLKSDTDWSVAAGSRLRFRDTLDLGGQTLTVSGHGNRNIDGPFTMLGGTLVTDGRNQITFSTTSSATLDGTLEFVPYPGASLAPGAAHDLFNGIEFVADTFDTVVLPQLGGGLTWNTSALYTTGIVTVEGVLGDYNLDGTVDAADYTVWRDSMGSDTERAADGNQNGVIDDGDYTVWRSNYGNTQVGNGQLSHLVPEPASSSNLILTFLILYKNWLNPRLIRTSTCGGSTL